MNIMSQNEFRNKLAYLQYEQEGKTFSEIESIRNEVVRFTSILASLFGDTLDRLTLWEKISSAILSSAVKTKENNIDEFINMCLETIKSEHKNVAASDSLLDFISMIELRKADWKQEFIRYIKKYHYVIVVKARARWQEYKKGRLEL